MVRDQVVLERARAESGHAPLFHRDWHVTFPETRRPIQVWMLPLILPA